MSSGCGCKDVYRFPHITYSYIYTLLYALFLQQHPYFLIKKKCFSFFIV